MFSIQNSTKTCPLEVQLCSSSRASIPCLLGVMDGLHVLQHLGQLGSLGGPDRGVYNGQLPTGDTGVCY